MSWTSSFEGKTLIIIIIGLLARSRCNSFFKMPLFLQIVISEDESNGTLSLSSRIIPAARILSLQKTSAVPTARTIANRTTILNHQTCPFSSLLVVAELNQATEKLERYEISPPSLTKSRLHDQSSLLIYQGLLHLVMDLRERGSKMVSFYFNEKRSWNNSDRSEINSCS